MHPLDTRTRASGNAHIVHIMARTAWFRSTNCAPTSLNAARIQAHLAGCSPYTVAEPSPKPNAFSLEQCKANRQPIVTATACVTDGGGHAIATNITDAVSSLQSVPSPVVHSCPDGMHRYKPARQDVTRGGKRGGREGRTRGTVTGREQESDGAELDHLLGCLLSTLQAGQEVFKRVGPGGCGLIDVHIDLHVLRRRKEA